MAEAAGGVTRSECPNDAAQRSSGLGVLEQAIWVSWRVCLPEFRPDCLLQSNTRPLGWRWRPGSHRI